MDPAGNGRGAMRYETVPPARDSPTLSEYFMVAGLMVALLLQAAVEGSAMDVPGPRMDALRVGVGAVALDAPADTTRARRKSFQLSDAYETRLKIHKVASYAMLPIFAGQYLAGDQLMKKGSNAPSWARSTHGALATAVAGLFAVNTVTGSLNWW